MDQTKMVDGKLSFDKLSTLRLHSIFHIYIYT